MTGSTQTARSILIVSDSATEGALIKRLLEDDFGNVETMIVDDVNHEDAGRHCPDVLILTFKDLRKSEHFYLGLYRHGIADPLHRHRTVILCSREDINVAYELCRRRLFDDYVLFWPVAHDTKRLLISVHRALDELDAIPDDNPSAAAFAAGARHLAELESLLSQQLARGQEHIASTSRAIAKAERDIGAVLDNLPSRALHDGLPGQPHTEGRTELAAELARYGRESVLPHLHSVGESLRPLTEWAGDIKQAVTPHLESARALGALAAQVRPIVLVVDDDEFQLKVTGQILESEGYQPRYAASGSEALSLLRRAPADLILMDFLMPEMNGLEVIKHLKSEPRLASVPVIMITGNSEKSVVVSSRKSGAVDFIVKPFERNALLDKLAQALRLYAHHRHDN